jgi:hypothetical protein
MGRRHAQGAQQMNILICFGGIFAAGIIVGAGARLIAWRISTGMWWPT